tara:strand:- start:197 stop:397 length:201 start_codon:yes stop_codon:yes gene_type:complete
MSNKERGSHARSNSIPDSDGDQRRFLPSSHGVRMIITVIETMIVMSMPFLLIGAFMETAAELELEA